VFHGTPKIWREMADLFAMLAVVLLAFGFLTWLFSRITDADLLLFMGILSALLAVYYLLKASDAFFVSGVPDQVPPSNPTD
jgi:hypothetical protein